MKTIRKILGYPILTVGIALLSLGMAIVNLDAALHVMKIMSEAIKKEIK